MDVNVLIALFDADHSLHSQAIGWFDENGKAGWASCPLTQNGCIRIMSQPGYPNSLPVNAVAERLRAAVSHSQHEFWGDDVSALDKELIDFTRVHGPKQLTDVYLLALAVSRGGRLVTFDRSLPISAAIKAQKKNLIVI
ncbi:MAG: TA system VapC family ribonuclease toxin [Usitatibacter sp.]